MTDLDRTVPQPRNKALSFWAFEKERWQSVWRNIKKQKVTKQNEDINPIALTFDIFQSMHTKVKIVACKMVGSGLISAVFEGLEPFFNMLVLGALPALLHGSSKDIVIFLIYWGIFCLREVLDPLFNDLRYYFTHQLRRQYIVQECADKYEDIINKPRAFFVVNNSATLSDMVIKTAGKKIDVFFDALDLGRGVVVLIITAASLFFVSAKLLLIMVLLCLLYMEVTNYSKFLLRGFENKARLLGTKIHQINRDVMSCSSLVQEALNTIKEKNLIVKRLNREAKMCDGIDFLEFKMIQWTKVVLLTLIAIVVAVFAVNDVIQSKDIGRFVLISGAAFKFRWRCYQLVSWYSFLLYNRNVVVDTEKQLVTPKALERQCGEKKLCDGDNKIILKNVEFSYPKIKDVTKLESEEAPVERGEKVLLGVNVEITKGGVTVIAGTSGQGKSTLMNLIRHDYDVTGGQVLIGDTNVQEVSDDVVNAQISFVDQNVHFFDNTLLYNLKYFNQSASEEAVQRALDSAGLSDDVAHFKDGVFHRIGQDGRALSGGQRQRLALARTFLTDRPIVIMDEPTTGLDQVLSFKVMKALREMSKTKTVLLVTHNPTEIALADRILIVQSGKIVADGTPLKLIETSEFLSSAMTKQDILSKQELFSKV